MTTVCAVGIVPGEEELGIQRQCQRCRDWWPFDDEFWPILAAAGTPYQVRSPHGQRQWYTEVRHSAVYRGICIACYAEVRAHRRETNAEAARRYRARLVAA